MNSLNSNIYPIGYSLVNNLSESYLFYIEILQLLFIQHRLVHLSAYIFYCIL